MKSCYRNAVAKRLAVLSLGLTSLPGSLTPGFAADPLSITQRGLWSGSGVAHELKLNGRRLYVAGDAAGLIELDVTDPDNPVKTAEIRPPDIHSIRALDVVGDVMVVGHSFGSTSREFIRTIDASIPGTPSILASASASGSVAAAGVAILGNHAFSVVQAYNDPDALLNPTRETLKIVDISNPNVPVLVAERDILDGADNSPGRAVFAANGRLYALTQRGLRIYDVTSPANPPVLGERVITGNKTDVFVSGAMVYVSLGVGGVQILDASNPDAIGLLGTLVTSGPANGAEVIGNRLYVAAGSAGVEVHDVSNPANPTRLGSLATDDARDLLVDDRLIYVADGASGVKVLQVLDASASAPAITLQPRPCNVVAGENCTLVIGAVGGGPLSYQWRRDGGPIPGANSARLELSNVNSSAAGHYDVVVSNATGVVTSETASLNILALAALTQRGSWSGIGTGAAHELKLKDQRLYVAGDEAGLIELNVVNPSNPIKAAEIRSPDILPIRALDVAGNMMVVGHSFGSASRQFVRTIDVSNAGAPSLLGFVNADSSVAGAGVAISGNHAYSVVQAYNDPDALLSSTQETLKVVDISNPNVPALVAERAIINGTSNSPGRAVFIANGWLYALTRKGLQVYNLSSPANPTFLGERVITGAKTDIFVSGATAFVGLGVGGVLILDTSNPVNMTAWGVARTRGVANGLQVVGNRLYVASGSIGVEMFDVTSLAAPIRTAIFDTDDARDLQVNGRLVYVADGAAGVKVLERIDPPVFSSHPVSHRVQVGQSVTFSAFASENPAYQWQLNGADIAGATGPTLSLPSVMITDIGSYRCVASNAAGAVFSQTASLIVALPPTATITHPATVSTHVAPASFDIDVQAADQDGAVTKVELFLDTAKLGEDLIAPYSFSISNLSVGAYSFIARATDNESQTSPLAQVTVIVKAANFTPTIALAASATNLVEPASFQLNAAPVDADGTIVQVEFFEGGNKIGEAASAPFSLDLTGVPARSAPYIYTARATDNAGATSAISSAVNVNVHPRIRAIQSSDGYTAGSDAFVRVTLRHSGSLTSLGYNMSLPTGWTYLSDDSNAQIKSSATQSGTLEWGWFNDFPASPYGFTVRLEVPADESGVRQITGEVFGREGGPEIRTTATPDPLSMAPLSFHSADTDQNSRIGLSELLRVVSLFNHSAGNLRTGEIHAQNGTEDGYAPGPGAQTGQAHSTDIDGDWHFTLSELLRLISFYNYSSGDERTGEYHPEIDTEDGFAPGPSGLRASSLLRRVPAGPAPELASLTSAATDYIPGNTVTVNLRAQHNGSLKAMGWELDLPTGWTYASDTSAAQLAPAANQRGTLSWAWISGFPASPDAFDVVLNVPLDQTGDQSLLARLQLRDPARTLDSQSLTLSNGLSGPPPIITSSPTNTFVAPGGSVTLSVVAQGSGLAYQWQFNGTDIPGENTDTLTLANGSAATAGVYSVVVSNGVASVTETAAVSYFGDLNMYPGMLIGGRSGDVFRIEFAEVVGGSTNWIALTNLLHPGGVFFYVDRSGANQSRRFYRANIVP